MALLLVAMLATPLVVPGVLEEPDADEDFRRSVLSLQTADSEIQKVSVPGDTVNFRLDTRLAHRGGTAENVTLEVRVVDGDTGLLVDQRRQSVGDIEGERSISVLTNFSVAREGSYRIETVVYENGSRTASGTRQISGVEALTPEYADSAIQFERFETSGTRLPTITYQIDRVQNNRTTLNVSAYLTNSGGAGAGDVTVVFRARQADSNAVAATTRREVSSIRSGETVSPGVTLTVPDDYNYWLDAMLMKDGVIIGTATEPANLDPTETLEANETRRDIEFDSGDFAGETETEPRERETEAPRATTGSGPGFGVAVTLVALLGAALLARRQIND